MTDHTSTSRKSQAGRPGSRLLAAFLVTLGLVLLLASTAMAVSKQPVDFFGGTGVRGGQFRSSPEGIAVNESGAGPANPGDIYVSDPRNNRIQRFDRDDNGTPSQGSDDAYSFISAWGAGVDPSSGGNGFEVCTVAEDCREGIANGSGGALSTPAGIAVDQDTGDVYVADRLDNRISAYSGDGTFLRSFGFDVIASGPGDAGTGYEVCVAANGDVCKAGLPGSGVGQVGANGQTTDFQGIAVSPPDGSPATGTVFLADGANQRIDTYHLDGSSPASFGSASLFNPNKPRSVAVDSRGIVYASNSKNSEEVERYDSENANGGGVGFLTPIAAGVNEVQQVTIDATAGTFNLTYHGETTVDLPFDAPANEPLGKATPSVIDSVFEALVALPSIGGQNPGDSREIGVRGTAGEDVGEDAGTSPYRIEFDTGLGATNVEQITAASGATPLSGGAGVSATTLTTGQPGLIPGNFTTALAVDPDADGAGPDTDTLYVQRTAGSPHVVQQFGPANAPGLPSPPFAFDDVHGTTFGAFLSPQGLAMDQPSGRLYVGAFGEPFGGVGSGVYVLDTPGPGPSASLDSLSDLTPTSATAHATITPNGVPALSYRLEYSTDGVKWESTPNAVLGTQKTPQSVSPVLNPPGGLEPNTLYHVRLVAKRAFFPTIVSAEKTFTTLAAPPLAETMGSPLRTTSTVRLDGSVSPRNSATSYHFEYGEQGPCDANPCTATAPQAIGSGGTFQLVSQQIEGLAPNTTYHYRVIADNGNPGSPVAGEDMTVTTRGDEAPLSHGHLPGPVGSDRAWEMVSAPDTGGNPVSAQVFTISDAGDRAVYGVAGGTPDSEAGLSGTQLFAERTASGWKTRKIHPSREVATGAIWRQPGGPSDLSSLVVENIPPAGRLGEYSLWRLSPNDPPAKLYASQDSGTAMLATSEDGSRVLATYRGPQDPSHPVPAETVGLYDLNSGAAQLISLLPDGTLPPCGVSQESSGGPGLPGLGNRLRHIVSADGSLAFFPTRPCVGGAPERLYMRDIPAETTTQIGSSPISGPECGAYFIKSIPGAVFFYSQSRLVADDVEPEKGCINGDVTGGDVYRYDIDDGSLDCLTCLTPGLDGEVSVTEQTASINGKIGVSQDGSRVYFTSRRRLLPGAPASGGIYRLAVASKSLAYVGAFGFIGDTDSQSYMNPDGSVVVFKSDKPSVNAVGGQQNGGTMQYYRYDDRDRSLICISCPADGSLPRGPATGGSNLVLGGPGANLVPLSDDGETFAFPTPTSLVPADQNTAGPGQAPDVGMDIYEWRAGRLLLVSDGLTKWLAGAPPAFAGITPSGHDIFFTAAIQYTKDALDGYKRLYDARIGGGFEFPPPPKPCPLEVCQGVPKGAPEEAAPGTASIVGAGNVPKTGRVVCAKPKRKVRKNGKTRCVKPKPARKKASHQRANHERRTAR